LEEREWRAPTDDNGNWPFGNEDVLLIAPGADRVAKSASIARRTTTRPALKTKPRLTSNALGEIVET
jgi:hypothetical protein